MEIPLNAQVECSDGVCGRSLYVLINPVIDEITHLVVRAEPSGKEYLVPVEALVETIAGVIQLRIRKADLEMMPAFIKTTFIQERLPDIYSRYGGGYYEMGSVFYVPYVIPDLVVQTPVEKKQIPEGELAVRRGSRVEASDGYVGSVDEFVVDPHNRAVTHLVMREGHLWGRKDVIIPVSAIGEIKDDTVHLQLNKKQIEALPNFPLRRRWA